MFASRYPSRRMTRQAHQPDTAQCAVPLIFFRARLRWITIAVFVIRVAVVLVWYFTYGIRHSHLNDLRSKT